MSKAHNKRAARERQQGLANMRQVLKTRPGRLVLWDLLSTCGFFRNAFDEHNGRMSFNCGRQSVAEELMELINEADSDAYLLMQKENRERQDGKGNQGTVAEPGAGDEDDGDDVG